MSKYTPQEWDVRTIYVTALKGSFAVDRDEGDAAFDRFIAKVKSDARNGHPENT